MKLDKPITVPVRHLLGAVGTGVIGFRIGDYIGKRARENGLRRSNPSHPEQIADFVTGLLARALKESPEELLFVRREAIAAHLEVPEHFVAQAFERLNKLGILGPESNQLPHDVVRGEHGSRSTGWTGTVRYVDREKLSALLAARPQRPEDSSTSIRPRRKP